MTIQRENSALFSPLHIVRPPSPHDPDERAGVYGSRGWEIRVYPWNDIRHRTFAGKGMLHLQLWCPSAGVSILTPSQLTDSRYELWINGDRFRLCCMKSVASMTIRSAGVKPPCSRLVRSYESQFVWLPTIGAVDRGRRL
jgi:hypothetical protein